MERNNNGQIILVTDSDDEKFVDGEYAEIRDIWFADAKNQTKESFSEFMRHILRDYQHDYGSIVDAIAACAIGAANAADHDEECGGITGFQANFVMWIFIKEWYYTRNKTGLRIIDFDDMLYPQYEEKFNSRTITSKRWKNLQNEAKKLLNEATEEKHIAEEVKQHWKSIVDGTVPFGWSISD